MLKLLLVYLLSIQQTVQGASPSWTGVWNSYINSLPNDKLPHVPLLGNGNLGIAINTDQARNPVPAVGPGRPNTIDFWLNSNGMWSCVNCNSFAPGCCALVGLGGVSISLIPTFGNTPALTFTAEQRIGPAQLYTKFTTSAKSTFETLTYMDPSQNTVITNISWHPQGNDPQSVTVLIGTWVLGSKSGGPTASTAGCADSTSGADVNCDGGTNIIQYLSRKAVPDTTSSPKPIWAALSTRIIGVSSGTNLVTKASNAWEVSSQIKVGTGVVSIVTTEAEVSGTSSDPSKVAIQDLITVTKSSNGLDLIRSTAANWWSSFWSKSSISLPTQQQIEESWYGMQYILATSSSTSNTIPPPGLYGPWVTQDNPAWNGDYTLDYNQESTYFGAFGSNHIDQTLSYYPPITAWIPAAEKEAQSEAATAKVTCPSTALHYACHLAPWGFQSKDQNVFMHWNANFAVLLFLNHFEYTLDLNFAKQYTYPLLDGINAWWNCFLQKTNLGNGKYVYEDINSYNPDEQHEDQKVPNPQIAIAFIKRSTEFQLKLANALGITAPSYVQDIYENLAAFNTAPYNVSNVTDFTELDHTRCFSDSGWLPTSNSVAECESHCASDSTCSIFSFCPNSSVSGCDAPPECFKFTMDKESGCQSNWTGWTSGVKSGDTTTVTAWSAYKNATVQQSDEFAMYPIWPAEYITRNSSINDIHIAQVSSKIYSDFANGRPVDLFPAAVRAGSDPNYDSWTPQDVINGLNSFIKNHFGPNLLLYADGGGIENVGVSRAINEMLVQAPDGKYIEFFPMWAQDQSASFQTLLVKGGFLVSASYNSNTHKVENVQITSTYTLPANATSTSCTILSPWGTGIKITVNCNGNQPNVVWNDKWFTFTAPKGVMCQVTSS